MMSKFVTHPFLAVLLPVVLASAGVRSAHAQPAPSDSPEDPYDTEDDDTAQDQQDATPDDTAPVQPPTAQPRVQPPAPPPAPPRVQQAPPEQQVQAAPAPAQAGGQWVYSQQYGWIWMPYGNQYIYAPEGVAAPSAYVYAPAYGWTWLAAPWVWGVGPRLYFSVGPRHFWWWGHPRFVRHGFVGGFRPGFRGGFRGPVHGGFRGGFRGGFGPVRGHVGGRVGGHFGHR